MKVLFLLGLTTFFLVATIAAPNNKHHGSSHKKGHLKRDASSTTNGTSTSTNDTETSSNTDWPNVFEPDTNNPFPDLNLLKKKHSGYNKNHHNKRAGDDAGNPTDETGTDDKADDESDDTHHHHHHKDLLDIIKDFLDKLFKPDDSNDSDQPKE